MNRADRFNALAAPHEPPRRHRVAYFAAAFVTAAVFGPYTTLPGVRMEHLAVYGSLVAGLVGCVWTRLRFSTAGALVFLLFLTETLVAILTTAQPAATMTEYLPGNPLAGVDNLLLPMAALVVGLMLVASGADPTRLVRIICTVLVVAMCLNTILAYISSIHDLAWLLSPFWDNENSRQTVAVRAAQSGRFSGVVNQPAEAGTLYGMAVLAAIYLYRDSALKMGISAAVLAIGGVLTISKVFLLLGLPIAAWQAIRVSGPRLRRLTILFVLGVFAAVAGQSGLVLSGVSGAFLSRLLRPSGNADNVMELYTAGRFGSSSSLQHVTAAVLSSSPWFGLGAQGLAVAYDNAWVEALVVAGIAGAVIYTAVLVTLALTWASRRRHLDPAQSSFAGGLVLIVIGASTGLPALTANRVATVAWLLLGLLLISSPREQRDRYSGGNVVPGGGIEGTPAGAGILWPGRGLAQLALRVRR